VLQAMSTDDRQDLSHLLGVDAQKLLPARRLEKQGPPVLQDMISTEEPRTGTEPRPATTPSAPSNRPADRFALGLAASQPDTSPPEVRTFLSNRRALRPGTLQVVVVLRQPTV